MEKNEVPSPSTTGGASRRDPAWQAAADRREDQAVARYRRQRLLARDIAEAARAADAMAHLEFSLRRGR